MAPGAGICLYIFITRRQPFGHYQDTAIWQSFSQAAFRIMAVFKDGEVKRNYH